MTLFFPDLNVWLALSVAGHTHSPDAWRWVRGLPADSRLIFSRFTQIGLLRLLTNKAVMGDQTLILRKAWSLYDRWLEDPRVAFYPEPRGVDAAFREVMVPLAGRQASNQVGDCWLLAFAREIGATLVTFDRPLHEYARKQGWASVIPV
jgi:toxin-antitoxin system PIN domain toxin